MTGRLKPVGAVCAAVMGITLAGCSTPATRTERSFWAVGSISLPGRTGDVGVTLIRPGPGFQQLDPGDKTGTARDYALSMAKDAGASGEAIILLPAAMVVAGMVGGAMGLSEAEIRTAAAAFEQATHDFNAAERIVDAITVHLDAARTVRTLRLDRDVPVEPPASRKRPVGTPGGRLAIKTPAPDRHPLADTDTQIVLGVQVMYQGFQAWEPPKKWNSSLPSVNPPLRVMLFTKVTAVRVRDWAPLGEIRCSYASAPRTHAEWAADHARALRPELEAGLQQILRAIKESLICEPALPTAPAG